MAVSDVAMKSADRPLGVYLLDSDNREGAVHSCSRTRRLYLLIRQVIRHV